MTNYDRKNIVYTSQAVSHLMEEIADGLDKWLNGSSLDIGVPCAPICYNSYFRVLCLVKLEIVIDWLGDNGHPNAAQRIDEKYNDVISRAEELAKYHQKSLNDQFVLDLTTAILNDEVKKLHEKLIQFAKQIQYREEHTTPPKMQDAKSEGTKISNPSKPMTKKKLLTNWDMT